MSTTVTAAVVEDLETSSASVSESLTSDLDGSSRVVRFDNECTLIPETSKRSKVLRTYSLPLWKRRPADSESEVTTLPPRGSLSPEETHVVVKVPIPRFISRSPTRRKTDLTSSPTPKPLSPCLVKRDPSSSPTLTRPKPIRRTSLPTATSPKQKADAGLTVPLRPCCADCMPITEESEKEGEQWQEKFSRGARRRRSASLDNLDNFSPAGSWSTTSGHSAAFAALAANPLQADLGPISNPRYRNSKFSITVDEVDKRRKSQEYTEEELNRFRVHSPSRSHHSPASASLNPFSRRTTENHSESTSNSLPSPASSELSPLEIPRRLKSSPIQEEDEDQLFPLPSPRRTPNTSPSPSVNVSPAASPNASTTYLVSVASASKDNLLSLSNASNEMLAIPLRRKVSNGRITHTARSSAKLQPSPKTVISNEQPIVPPPPSTLETPETLPKAQPSIPADIPAETPTPTSIKPLSISFSARGDAPSIEETSPSSISASPRTSQAKPIAIPSNRSRSTPSSSPTKMRRPSFSLPAIRDAIKGASADVLKGVSSMGGGGGIVGSV